MDPAERPAVAELLGHFADPASGSGRWLPPEVTAMGTADAARTASGFGHAEVQRPPEGSSGETKTDTPAAPTGAVPGSSLA
ncbi:hypothetical protein ACQP1W_03205 [Spirillospora sp. CA-255316]